MSGHSLRIGCATAYTAFKEAGPVVAGMMGLRVFGAQWDYVYACKEHRKPLRWPSHASSK